MMTSSPGDISSPLTLVGVVNDKGIAMGQCVIINYHNHYEHTNSMINSVSTNGILQWNEMFFLWKFKLNYYLLQKIHYLFSNKPLFH